MLILSYGTLDIPGVLIRLYGIALGIGVILTEFELTEIVRTFILLQKWVTRGAIYIFIGLLAYEHTDTSLDASSLTYINFSSLSLIGIGGLYSVMGIFCLKKLRFFLILRKRR